MRTTILAVALATTLTGCFGPNKLDATSEQSIKSSIQELRKELAPEKADKFGKAITYYSVGGSEGFKRLFTLEKNNEQPSEFVVSNLKKLDGLTAEQILDKYEDDIEQDKIRKEEERLKKEKLQAEQAAIIKLRLEAEALLKSKEFESAIKKYEEIGSISGGTEAAKIGIDNAKEQMNVFAEKMNYIKNIEVTEFVAKRIDTYSQKRAPAVRISLKNNGDRSLDMVETTVFFYDKEDKIIFEEIYRPVLVSKYNFSNNQPLKPGYVREMESDKYYVLESNLSEWKNGAATVKITDIRFTE
ncbi:hypothetical protein CGH63_12060 [Vibrio parahaemolyticus]|uniref:DUF6694 family lipoprotein n=5 Tax=Vibrio parahaemolyticus TaxID=670 RepID=UPI0011245729|nr:DUF6694 family lipoprotein [Vibrio parahaemolyticus]TON10908.1 hypothetical protein CGH63_12060 [Vibrio parahaemolyticus]